jgi:hypothetical protein
MPKLSLFDGKRGGVHMNFGNLKGQNNPPHGKPFQPSLTFLSKANAYLSGSPFRWPAGTSKLRDKSVPEYPLPEQIQLLVQHWQSYDGLIALAPLWPNK